jgi:hypothetical protein
MLHNEEDMLQLIKKDKWMMSVLNAVRMLNLHDWWVCAGFVRAKIWDNLHGYEKRTETPDIDVIYFDDEDISEHREKMLEQQLRSDSPDIPWSVKNQARMHVINNVAPYHSSVEAMSKFPETATALGVTLDADNRLILAAPFGIKDLLEMKVKPTPFFMESAERLSIYEERVSKKNWKAVWPNIEVTHSFEANL